MKGANVTRALHFGWYAVYDWRSYGKLTRLTVWRPTNRWALRCARRNQTRHERREQWLNDMERA